MSDLEEMVRTRRFDEIHEARRQVIEDERSLNEALATGRIDDSRARRLFQRAVDAYVRELEYLLNPPDNDEINDYWDSVEIGRIALPDGRAHVVGGLAEYLDLPEEIEIEVTSVDRSHYYELGDEVAETRRVQPPWRVLRSAFRTANAAVAELGLELDVEDGGSDRWDFREIEDIEELNPEEWGDLSIFDNAAVTANGGGGDD
jgi:hypothetical protein